MNLTISPVRNLNNTKIKQNQNNALNFCAKKVNNKNEIQNAEKPKVNWKFAIYGSLLLTCLIIMIDAIKSGTLPELKI